MGGYGSGRWYSSDRKTTVESQQQIDIRWLKKQGGLRPGTMGSVSWSRCGGQTDSISYRTETDFIIFNYRYRLHGDEWEDVEQCIKLDRTSCNYGGYRLWFLCSHCFRRVAILYDTGEYFLCRHCYGLTYSSQQKSKAGRLRQKARKIRARLGASSNLMEPISSKPKNMHQKTFDHLRREADSASNLSWLIMEKKLNSIERQLDSLKQQLESLS